MTDKVILSLRPSLKYNYISWRETVYATMGLYEMLTIKKPRWIFKDE